VDQTDKGQLGKLEGAAEDLMTTAGSEYSELAQHAGNMLLLDALSGPMSRMSFADERLADVCKGQERERQGGEPCTDVAVGATGGQDAGGGSSEGRGEDEDVHSLEWKEEKWDIEWRILDAPSSTSSTISSSSFAKEDSNADPISSLQDLGADGRGRTASGSGDGDATESFEASSPSSHSSSKTYPADSTLDCSLLDETLDESPRERAALALSPAVEYPPGGSEYSRFMLLRAASSEARNSLVVELGEEEFARRLAFLPVCDFDSSIRYQIALEAARRAGAGSESGDQEERNVSWQM